MAHEDRDDWPSPEFDRAGTDYFCGICSTYVQPNDGDAEAGLLVAGGTWKLCYDCSTDLRDRIDSTGSDADVSDLFDGEDSK